jgi:pseudouridine synthase
MRLNQFIAAATGMSRRAADSVVSNGRVRINGQVPLTGQRVVETDVVTLDGVKLSPPERTVTILFNKPAGYVCSRNGQGSATVYDLLPADYNHLKPVGRLDKDSSGLLLLTNDGRLAHELTHPSFHKQKIYEVTLDKPLADSDNQRMLAGVPLNDGVSAFDELTKLQESTYRVTLHEGRNRQIRRTFGALGYDVTNLHRTRFGEYTLEDLGTGKYRQL